MPLAMVTGMAPLNMPYSSHISVPNANSEYMASDMPEVSFVLMVCIACGKNEMVVQKAATSPITVTNSLLIYIQDNPFGRIRKI
jgi:hypothetical protein